MALALLRFWPEAEGQLTGRQHSRAAVRLRCGNCMFKPNGAKSRRKAVPLFRSVLPGAMFPGSCQLRLFAKQSNGTDIAPIDLIIPVRKALECLLKDARRNEPDATAFL
jgi:hypothetical protein